MKILCTVCVRTGSKGLRDKNFLKIKNRYLLSYTLNVAIKSKLFSHIVVSTDSKKIRSLKKHFKKEDTYLDSKKGLEEMYALFIFYMMIEASMNNLVQGRT